VRADNVRMVFAHPLLRLFALVAVASGATVSAACLSPARSTYPSATLDRPSTLPRGLKRAEVVGRGHGVWATRALAVGQQPFWPDRPLVRLEDLPIDRYLDLHGSVGVGRSMELGLFRVAGHHAPRWGIRAAATALTDCRNELSLELALQPWAHAFQQVALVSDERAAAVTARHRLRLASDLALESSVWTFHGLRLARTYQYWADRETTRWNWSTYSHQHALTSGPRVARGPVSARPWLGLYLAEQRTGGERSPADPALVRAVTAWLVAVPVGVDAEWNLRQGWGITAAYQLEALGYTWLRRHLVTASVAAHW
jgi:hypothetical protein